MAGEKLAPGGNCHIFCSRAATRNSLVDAGAVLEIEHIVIEGKGASFLLALDHFLCEYLVLLEDLRHILFGERVRIVGRTYHGLHAKLSKAEVSHVEYIVREINVVVSKGAANVVILAAARLYEFLELRHYLIVASVARVIAAEMVVDLFSSVKAENYVAHLLVEKIYYLVVDKDSVSGKREAEVLVMLLLDASRVSHELLDNVPVHQRLAAEEVNLKVVASARVFDKEVKGALAYLKAHKSAIALILALTCKAIGAVEVAGVCNVQAESLYDLAVILVIAGKLLVLVNREQLSCLLERGDIVDALKHLALVYVGQMLVSLKHSCYYLFCRMALIHFYNIVSHLVNGMYRSACGVKNDVISVKFILMYHIFS